MRRTRPRCWRPWVAGLFLPPVLIQLLLAWMPTEWAVQRIQNRLEEVVGQPVQIRELRFGPLGGIVLKGVRLGNDSASSSDSDPDSERNRDPWLEMESVRLDLSLFQLFLGQTSPERVEVRGLTATIRRDADGRLALTRAIDGWTERGAQRHPDHVVPPIDEDLEGEWTSADSTVSDPPLKFVIADSRLIWDDQVHDRRIVCEGLESHGSWSPGRLTLAMLRGQVRSGLFELIARIRFDAPRGLAFDGHMRLESAEGGDGFSCLRPLLPLAAIDQTGLDGKVDLDLYLESRGRTADEVLANLQGRGRLTLDPVRMNKVAIAREIASLLDHRTPSLGSVTGQFHIHGRRVHHQQLSLDIGPLPITLVGWTAFDGRIDYRLGLLEAQAAWADATRGLMNHLQLDREQISALRIRGRLDEVEVVWIDPESGRILTAQEAREKIHRIGQGMMDRLFR